jgi:hypothetical protein
MGGSVMVEVAEKKVHSAECGLVTKKISQISDLAMQPRHMSSALPRVKQKPLSWPILLGSWQATRAKGPGGWRSPGYRPPWLLTIKTSSPR